MYLYLPVKNVEFANSIDPDKVAHNEPSYLGLQCLPSHLWIFIMIRLDVTGFEILQM